MAELYWWQPNESHNGYLETYLNLGLIGVLLLFGWLFSTFWKIRRDLVARPHWGRYEIGLFAAILVYKWTEAVFRRLHPVWFIFQLISIQWPGPQFTDVRPLQSAEIDDLAVAQKEVTTDFAAWHLQSPLGLLPEDDFD